MSTARLYAICTLAAAWHDGQASRVYRIGCRARRLLARKGITRPLDQVDGRDRWPAHFRKRYVQEVNRMSAAFMGPDRH